MSNGVNINISASAQGVEQTASALEQMMDAASAPAAAPAASSGSDKAFEKVKRLEGAMKALQAQMARVAQEMQFSGSVDQGLEKIDRLEKAYQRIARQRFGGSSGASEQAALNARQAALGGGTDDAARSGNAAFARQLTIIRDLATAYRDLNAALIPALRSLRIVANAGAAVNVSGINTSVSALNSMAKALRNLGSAQAAGGSKSNSPTGGTVQNQSAAVNAISNALQRQTTLLTQQARAVSSLNSQYAQLQRTTAGLFKNAGGRSPGLNNPSAPQERGGSGTNASQAFIGGVSAVGLFQLAQSMVEVQQKFDAMRNTLSVGVDSSKVGEEFAYIQGVSERLGLSLFDVGAAYSKMTVAGRSAGLSGEDTRKVFEGISTASAAMGLSAEDTKGAMLALQQMMSKGKISAEELRGQLGERIPGAVGFMAKALGVTTAELDKMLEQGVVPFKEGLLGLAQVMKETFEGGINTNSLSAQLNRLQTQADLARLAISKAGAGETVGQGVGFAAQGLRAVANADLSSIFAPLLADSKTVGAVFTAIATSGVVVALGSMAAALTALIGPAGPILGFAGAVTAALAAFASTDPEFFPKIVDGFKQALSSVTEGLAKGFEGVTGNADFIASAFKGLGEIVGTLAQAVGPLVAAFGVFTNLLGAVGSLLKGDLDRAKSFRQAGEDTFGNYLLEGEGVFADLFRLAVGGLTDNFGIEEIRKQRKAQEEKLAEMDKKLAARKKQLTEEAQKASEEAAAAQEAAAAAARADADERTRQYFGRGPGGTSSESLIPRLAEPFADIAGRLAFIREKDALDAEKARGATAAAIQGGGAQGRDAIEDVAKNTIAFIEKKQGLGAASALQNSLEGVKDARKAAEKDPTNIALDQAYKEAVEKMKEQIKAAGGAIEEVFKKVTENLAQTALLEKAQSALQGQEKTVQERLKVASEAKSPESFRLSSLTSYGTDSFRRAADLRNASGEERLKIHQRTLEDLLRQNNSYQEKNSEALKKLAADTAAIIA